MNISQNTCYNSFRLVFEKKWIAHRNKAVRFLKAWFKIMCFYLLLIFYSCTEYVDIDLETTSKRLIVDGMVMSEQKFHYVRLTQSVPFLSDTISPPVSGATVMLSDGNQSEQLIESDEYPGFYISLGGIVGQAGKTYRLLISDVDINDDGVDEVYSSSCYMPTVTQPDSIKIVYDNSWEVWKVLLYAKDNPDVEDYYLFRIFKNGTLISDRLGEYSVVSDQFFDGGVANGVWVQSIADSDEHDIFSVGDVVTLQMCGITKEYYEFIKAVQEESRYRYPLFSGPPANVEGNITNGGLGFFAAFSAKYAFFKFDTTNLMK